VKPDHFEQPAHLPRRGQALERSIDLVGAFWIGARERLGARLDAEA